MANDNPTGSGGGNGGVLKGVTDVASKTVGALSGFPMLLVLTLLNAATLGMVTYLMVQAAEYRATERHEILQILTSCLEDAKKNGASFRTPGWLNENTQKANQNTP